MTPPKPTLTDAQIKAIEHEADHLQIVACAGSGKTETLARRAVRLMTEGNVDPSAIIAFTFTEKAAGELKERIEERAAEADPTYLDLPPVGRGMFIGTTHGWALQALRQLGGIYETMDALSQEQEWALLYRMARRLGLVDLYAAHPDKRDGRIVTAKAVDVFLRSAEVVHNEDIPLERVRAVAPDFAAALERYERLLEDMRLLPFRLMIRRACEELGEGGRLRPRLAGRVAHVLVDEAQDFNRAQERVLAALAEMGARITVVGDDDQAIYQWRGGDVSLFVGFTWRHAGAHKAELATNHRCRPEIVAFARHLAERLPERLDKDLSAGREPAKAGAVEMLLARTPEEEARCVAERIETLLAEGHTPGEVAVLYRSVRSSARPLVEELRKKGIPAAVVGQTSLLARPEMALIARVFIWWAGGVWYPNDDRQPESVTSDSLLGEIRAVAGLSEAQAGRALGELESLGARVREGWVRDIVALYDRILELLGLPAAGGGANQEMGLGQMSQLLTHFERIVRRAAPGRFYLETGTTGKGADTADEATEDAALIGPVGEAAEGAGGPAAARAAALEGKVAAGVGAATHTVLGMTAGEIYLRRLRAFLEEFAGRAAEETPDNSPQAADSVRVMTVHQAKGLEFPIVFVPCLVEGRFPSARCGQPQLWHVPDELFSRSRYQGREEDEARLLYVALTRARELLVLSAFEQYTSGKPARLSRFLTDHLREAFGGVAEAGSAVAAPAKVAVHREPLVLDFQSLALYQECGYRYWLSRVCGFQPLLAPELGFGRVLHHLVAELARLAMAGGRPTGEDVERELERSFYLPFAGPVPAQRLREAAGRRVRAYVRRHADELGRVLQPEMPFEIPLDGARIRGRVDLVLRAQGEDGPRPKRVELIDLKTSENRPPSETHKNQLRLYALTAERMGYEPVGLYIDDLDADNGGRLEVTYDDKARDAFVQQLLEAIEGIAEGQFGATGKGEGCGECDFRTFCRRTTDVGHWSYARNWRV